MASRVTIQVGPTYVIDCVECGKPCYYTGWADVCDRVCRM